MNVMREIKIEKITLNVGAGKDQTKLEKGIILLKNITGLVPVKTFSKKRIPEWGLRVGLPIGCKITLRREKATDLLKRLLEGADNKLSEKQFDNEGNVAFGIHEYINIPDVKYDPKIGVTGLEVCITLERKGYRIKRRAIKKKKIPLKHKISKKESIEFIQKKFNIIVGEK